jgi:hypothetical protein
MTTIHALTSLTTMPHGPSAMVVNDAMATATFHFEVTAPNRLQITILIWDDSPANQCILRE